MRRKIMIVFLVLILSILNYGIYNKEQIKEHGEILLLELAPIDPRSLLQGDYMNLGYFIENDEQAKELALQEKRGYIVIYPDENKVAQFIRFYKGESLAAGEKLLYFHKRNSSLRIVPNAFFFQEGHAKYYEDAKYGVFKFNDSAEYLLVGLADENRKTIRIAEVENDQK